MLPRGVQIHVLSDPSSSLITHTTLQQSLSGLGYTQTASNDDIEKSIRRRNVFIV